MAAVAAHVHAHVLDDAEHGHVDLLEHLEALAGVGERDVLRRGDDDGARDRHALRERELDVAGAGRHVDHEVVEIAPVRVAEQLGQRLRDHRSAPHHRLLGIDEEADRHGREPMRHERLDAFAVRRCGPLTREAQHDGLARPVDVGIEQPDPRALPHPGERKVCCDGGLADAAFARGDGHDVPDARLRRQLPLHGVCGDLLR